MMYAGTNGATFTVGATPYTVPANTTVPTSGLVASGTSVTVAATSYSNTPASTWTYYAMPASGQYGSMVYNSVLNLWVTANYNSTTGYTSSGAPNSFTSMTLSASNWFTVPIVYNSSGLMVAMNNSGTGAFMYSSNGTTWTSGTVSPAFQMESAACSSGTFSVVGSGSTGAYSTSGTSFSSMTMPYSTVWYNVKYNGTTFLALDSSTHTAYSTNGYTWSAGGSWQYSTPVYGLAYGNSTWVAIPYTSSSFQYAYTTNVANPWTAATFPTTSNYPFNVAYGNGYFVMTPTSGANGCYSTTGTTWTLFSYNSTYGSSNSSIVVYGNNYFHVNTGASGTSSTQYIQTGTFYITPVTYTIIAGPTTIH